MSPDVILNRMEVKRLESEALSKEQIHENVNSPKHYSEGEIECIDAMTSAFGDDMKTYCKINAFKYIFRSGKKDSEEQDLKKAIWYLRFAVGDDPRKDS